MHIKNAKTGPIHAPKQQILMKNVTVYNPYKNDGTKVAKLKQQISQNVILLRSTVTFRQLISSFL